MSVIAFLVDSKEGHIIPTFKLAYSLQQRGHDVIYLSIPDNEKIVKEQGFKFFAIFRDIYPQGFNQSNKIAMDQDFYNNERKNAHLVKIMDGELDILFHSLKPDLFVISTFLSLEVILLHYKYNIRPVLLTTYLRSAASSFLEECMGIVVDLPVNIAGRIIGFVEDTGISFTSLEALLQPLNNFHEIILCPQELDIDLPVSRNNVHYTGPSVFKQRDLASIPVPGESTNGKKIIYASLGSYAVSYGDACRHFFETVVSVMRHKTLESFHVILAVGSEYDIGFLDAVPQNVTVVRWVSQVDILQKASLTITHGGLGTIKESIYFGVPMIVFPIRYDQVRNAILVEYHKLGLRENIQTITTDKLRASILYTVNNSTIEANVKKMEKIFVEKESAESGIGIIERMIAGTFKKTSFII